MLRRIHEVSSQRLQPDAIRGHLTEYGWIAPKGPSHVAMLADLLEEEEMASSLPEAARAMFRLMLDLLASLDGKIADLDKEIAQRAREDDPRGATCRLRLGLYVRQ